VLTSILIALSLIACAKVEQPTDNKERVNILISTMHTYISGHVYVDKELKDEVESGIEEIFDLYNDLTDNFAQQGDVKGVYYINQQAELALDSATVEIEKELYDLLQFSIDIMIETDGYFDITMGKVVKVWKDLIDEIEYGEIVSDERLNEVYQTVDAIVLPEDPISLSTTDGKYFVTLKHGASIDLGAVAKGYAVQKVVDYIESKGIESYLISGGSSSIVYGKNNPRTASGDYVIELVNPLNPVMFGGYAEYDGQNKSITTSGSYEQYVEDQHGNWYHHIISPKTRRPANYYYTLTIIGQDAGLLDAFSTALFCMKSTQVEAFLKDKCIEAGSLNLDSKLTTYFRVSGYRHK